MPLALVDTNVLLALLASRDHSHHECKLAFEAAPKPLITTAAIMTELFHFILKREPWLLVPAWQLFTNDNGMLRLAALTSEDLPALEALMRKYADRPMDFADATLVHVVGREGISDILTIDHDDFETYRFGRNRKFRIAPGR